MKLLLVILAFLTYATLFVRPIYANDQTRAELVALAKRVHQEDIRREELRQLNLRVQAEAQRLGVAQTDTSRLSVIRNILVTFGSDYRMALAIAKSESGLRCEAYHWNNNNSVDIGPFQLNNLAQQWRFGGKKMDNCELNVQVAYEIFKDSFWYPWVVYQKGSYLAYL